ncbi:MAG: peptidylprolyl isomerase [Alphaproteobacteria bacterium]|nr:peptidylprolyl isomerase [Alphaproteobacteria bacterium]
MRPVNAADDSVVIKSGALTVTVAEIRTRVAIILPDATTAQRNELLANTDKMREIASSMLASKILVGEAKAKKLESDPITRDQIALARDEVLVRSLLNNIAPSSSIPEPTEKELREYYAQHKDSYVVGKQYRVAQIFVASTEDRTSEQKKEAKRKIDECYADLKGAKADQFARSARICSEDTANRDKGGELGWLVEDNIAPQYREVITKMKLGEISAPINTKEGWRIMRLMETKPAGPLPFEDVKENVVQTIKSQKLTLARQTYVDKLMADNKFEIKEDGLSAVKP